MTMADLIKAGATREAMATRLASLCWRPDLECFYFGHSQGSGHVFFSAARSGYDLEREVGRALGRGGLDTCLCWNGPRLDRERYDQRQRDETEGRALLTHGGGWTAVAFWDRSGDRRGASNTTFIVRGTLTFEQVIRVARHRWPSIWSRFTFEVVQVDEHGRRVRGGVDASS